ncbi:hypothetical protein CBO05C_2370 [Clostridium botulinum B str. Osaka05]|uniref:Uncharacterized protein n=1 Tax=Clostridium botulinum B str. Osaka05 TaxID=1407017 RepID=A0A0S6U6Z3_CLOBO|nr:hypothetical protein CBO05C_2370 [Clostridium botulinum B str. Osaka05]
MLIIGFNFEFTWENLIRYNIYAILINETPSPILEGVSDSRQIRDLGSLLKYISCYCSTALATVVNPSLFEFKYILC